MNPDTATLGRNNILSTRERWFSVNIATGLLNGHGYFVHWGVLQISLANLLVVLLMLVVFTLALVLPFHPADEDADAQQELSDAAD